MLKAKKIISIALIMLMMLCVAGCAKKGKCDACGKNAVLYRFTTTAGILGIEQSNTSKLCSDCLDDAIKAADADPLTTYTYEKIE